MKYPIMNLAGLPTAFNTHAQKLTKEQIVAPWQESSQQINTKDSIKSSFDQDLNRNVKFFIDSLEMSGIDSIIIYSILYPG